MAERICPPPPGASSDGLFACLRALAEEARSLGLAEAASMIDLAAECVAVEAEERGLCLGGPAARPRGIGLG